MEWGRRHTGFTLIEMSIVLVIIGLVVGGILMGRDLVRSSEVRAQISQIDKYNTAAQTFYGKYGYLPGDIPAAPASQFGFVARGQYGGEGDGNGVLEGNCCNTAGQTASTPTQIGIIEMSGETTVFWRDLSDAKLVDGSFNTATQTGGYGAGITGGAIGLYLPQAKIGRDNYIYAWSGGCCVYVSGRRPLGNGLNYFGLSAVTTLGAGGSNAGLSSTANIPVAMAHAIDQKTDDGLPLAGRVTAVFNGCTASSLGYAINSSSDPQATCSSLPAAKYRSAATCFDNGNVSGATMQYSLGQNGGANPNCALSFQFQ